MQANKWLLGLGIAAGLSGCGDLGLWSDDDAPQGSASSDASGGATGGFGGSSAGGGISGPPVRLPSSPTRAATPPPAISGGTLAVSPSGDYAVASDPDRNALYVLRLSDKSLGIAQLPAGAEPGRIAFDAAGIAHVILRGSGSVARVDLAQPAQLTTTKVCELPRGIAYASSDDTLAVACASGDLVRLAAADHVERSRSFIDTDLRDVIVNRAGKVLVSRYRTAELLEISAAGQLAKRNRPKEGTGFRFTETGDQNVTMLPAMGWRAVPTGDDQVLMMHQAAQREEVQPSPGGYGGFGDCSAITHPAVSIVGEGALDKGRSFGLGGIALAVDAALSPNQKWLAVAVPSGYLQARETVVVYSAVNPEPMQPSFPDAGLPPPNTGACAFPMVTDGFDAQFTAVAFTPDGRLIAQSREPARLQIFQITQQQPDWEGGTTWPILESTYTVDVGGISVKDSGHDLFHADPGGGITCASCHGEGGDDGLVWNFGGIGPRRTQNMRGGLKGTEPFHWDGEMLTFSHLVDNVLTGRMSGFVVEKPFADAMISWIDSQPAFRLPVTNASAAERGKALFESKDVACTTCHSGKSMTNNGSFDVGTGGRFQVPGLHGLGLRGPYMHNGCAKTLGQRFEAACGGGDKHGKTSHLSAAQLADLTTYLQTL